ncbi:MAG TPA: TetR family transcriptional regulator [Myxococcales bacterium]|nr:TetR family transcriptional regulator [Deltaproteobacteria bacterium]MBU50776.1 TetR family transcriptional regulator [Deltaproteobacteria bacterium]HAA53580.1 TetR family transcriptional regulator [Myxococcales bacterium]|tara:strand:+ start:4248 stop:4817 length:570 start_codon:yes stop_codon:yes gene_type:complete
MAQGKNTGGQTRQKLLDTAEQLFAKKGYSATGVQEILRESGAPRGSFYFHYPNGKVQLAVEAMKSSATHLQTMLAAQFTQGLTRQEKIHIIFAAFQEHLLSHQLELGCPTATIALEAPNEELQTVAQEIFREWERLIQEHLGMEEQEATALLSAVEGALMLSKVYGHPGPLRAVAKQYDVNLPTSDEVT